MCQLSPARIELLEAARAAEADTGGDVGHVCFLPAKSVHFAARAEFDAVEAQALDVLDVGLRLRDDRPAFDR